MAELLTSKRIKFVGEGTLFLAGCKKKLGTKKIASTFNVSERTVRDWFRGKYKMPLAVGRYIERELDINLPDFRVFDLKDHLKNISSKGGKARLDETGRVSVDEKYRRECWSRWWQNVGKNNPNSITKVKKIKIPKEDSGLAEFMGIMAGDGTVAPYHISITLNSDDDKDYARHVSFLVKKLFGVTPSIYKKRSSKAIDVSLSRKEASLFCQKKGLPLGDKVRGKIRVPDFVKNKKTFQRRYLKGLFDTDGSLFLHRYKSKKKVYERPVVSITNVYKPFLIEIYDILKKDGFSVRITKNQKELRIESKKDILRFFSEIGSNNQRKLKKFEKWRSAGAV